MKEKIRETAFSLGADDVRFICCSPTDPSFARKRGFAAHPARLLPGAKSVMALFFGYCAATRSEPPLMTLSGYYPRSHQGYAAAKELEGRMAELGLPALHTHQLHNAALCLRTGGYFGDNSLYFHEKLGSLISVQTIITTLEPDPPGKPKPGCVHCGRCAAACPTGAISNGRTDYTRCLRAQLTAVVPEDMRSHVYQLFGCEKCQTCCPGQQPVSPAVAFDTAALINGDHTGELRKLVGPNTARAGLIASQAALYAGANRIAAALPALERLAAGNSERGAIHAKWAVKQITDGQ